MIQKIINETYHETTGFTPIELHLNTRPTRVWEKWLSVPPVSDVTHERKIFLVRDRAHHKLKTRAKRENQNKKHFTFQDNDLVLIKALPQSDAGDKKIAKFFHVYGGPYAIKQKINADTYLIIDKHGKERGKFHISNLKPYYIENATNNP